MISKIEEIKRQFPNITPEELYDFFPRLQVEREPPLDKYSWEEWHQGFMGGGGLYLVDELARRMHLRPGMRVLDLACGNAVSSIYLAHEYGARVTAADLHDPSENWQRVKKARIEDAVTPVQMDARAIPFPAEYFDAVVCLNAYFYFGTDDLYLLYLTKYLRPCGWIAIASPCYREELAPDTPVELLYDEPPYPESRAVHSPGWWRQVFSRFPLFDRLECAEHPLGHELWLDDVRALLEHYHPTEMPEFLRAMTLQEMVMMLSDVEKLNTYLTILARKK